MFLTRIRSFGISQPSRAWRKCPGSLHRGRAGASYPLHPKHCCCRTLLRERQAGPTIELWAGFQRFATAGQFRFVDFKATDVLQFDALLAIPEMHDRIVVGVARALGLPLLTRDQSILHSGVVQTIW
jgi:hypothetical protein